MNVVYLAGPISGCTYGECTTWRDEFAKDMPKDIFFASPMRGKSSKGSTCREQTGAGEVAIPGRADAVLRQDAAIMARDFFDCNRAAVVVFYLLGATRVSIGTMMEAAWAYAKHTPAIFIMEKEGNIHDHPMLRQAIDYQVESVEEAKQVVRAILDTTVGHQS